MDLKSNFSKQGVHDIRHDRDPLLRAVKKLLVRWPVVRLPVLLCARTDGASPTCRGTGDAPHELNAISKWLAAPPPQSHLDDDTRMGRRQRYLALLRLSGDEQQ